MGTETAFFVQFPHPGLEHNPRTDAMPWNTAPHRRKFLIAPGRYTLGDDRIGEAELVCWGEWEPPSTVERRWPVSGRLPRALHRPWWEEPTIRGPRQNTDPWVFGRQMLYSNCKQVIGGQGRPTAMQRLTRGSVICFGSTIDHEFCVDTVFVVASSEPWGPTEVATLDVDRAFKTCTLDSIAEGAGDAHLVFTLYRGATIDDPVEGMFSFVPARLVDDEDHRFARPAVESRFINPTCRQSTWGSKRPLPIAEVRGEWDSIRDQILEADLLLAVGLRTPEQRSSDPEMLPQR